MKVEITLLGIEFLLKIKFPECKPRDRVWLNDESWIKPDGTFISNQSQSVHTRIQKI